MRLEKIQENLSKKFTLSGYNAPEQEVCFVRITDFFSQPFTDHLKKQRHLENPAQEILDVIRALKYIETITDQHLTEAEGCKPTPLPFIDGKVNIQPGCLVHKRPADFESIRSISQSAFLASEWFGIPETEDEGLFCSFLTKLIDQNDPSVSPLRKQYHKNTSVSTPTTITFYFDQNNPLMQKLIRLDYFEYARRVQECPEEIDKYYSAEEINMFKKLIYPLSPRGRSFHLTGERSHMTDWIAVPGAIPSELVNGISIHTENTALMENIEEIAKMFPSATIFDQEGKVLRMAKVLDDEKENITE